LISRTLLTRPNFAQKRTHFVEAGRHRHEIPAESKKAITLKLNTSVQLDSLVTPSLGPHRLSIFIGATQLPTLPKRVYRLYMLKFWLGEGTQTVLLGVFRLPRPGQLSNRLIEASVMIGHTLFFDQLEINLSIAVFLD
jgi:hypothetical protein